MLAHADVLIEFGLASNREQRARKRLPGGLKPGAVPARHHLYLLPKLCAASQQKNEEQNRNWDTQEPEQDVLVPLVSLLTILISIPVNTYSSDRKRPMTVSRHRRILLCLVVQAFVQKTFFRLLPV
jgi:hypothetical protein